MARKTAVSRNGSDALESHRGFSAYEAIKQDIISCVLTPGARFTEAQMVEQYSVSRNTVRTALNRLDQEGLVQVIPREGYLVAAITLKSVRDLFGVRLLLEPASTRMAAGRVDEAHLLHLQEVCMVPYIPGDRESIDRHLRANADFHISIARDSGNDQLASMVAGLHDQLRRLMHFTYLLGDQNESIHRNHHALIEALVEGDGARAEELSRVGIVKAQRDVITALLDSPTLNAVSLAVR